MCELVAPGSKMTFEEYRFYEEPDVMYELFRGRLIAMETPPSLHTRIRDFIIYILRCYFVKQNQPLVTIPVTGVRTEVDSSRIPGLVVCSEELWEKSCARSGAWAISVKRDRNSGSTCIKRHI